MLCFFAYAFIALLLFSPIALIVLIYILSEYSDDNADYYGPDEEVAPDVDYSNSNWVD